MYCRRCFAVVVILVSCAELFADNEPIHTALFVSGNDGYGRYRIPALIVSEKGTVLAFCEGRKKAGPLTGDIDIVLKRSFDHGKTWKELQLVADDADNTLGNPCPVIDRTTGVIWLAFTRSRGRDKEDEIVAGKGEATTVWLTHSSDDGWTWSKAEEISASVRKPNWTWYGTGPGVGVQLRGGRLVIPSYHAEKDAKIYRSHMIFSDDGGKTWKQGADIGDNTSECQVVEQADGTLSANCRSLAGTKFRTVAMSKDRGETWSKPQMHDNLPEPDCQGCLFGYTDERRFDRTRWLFANPPGPQRENVTLRLSYDEGRSWPISRLLYRGPSAYTSLTILPDATIGCLYERGAQKLYEEIAFAQLSLAWLTAGKDTGPVRKEIRYPHLIAHRGLLRHAPENTLPAFSSCLDLQLGFEFDVRRTRDGKLVCLHDETLQRTTDGSGKIGETTLADVRKLDAGKWFHPTFVGQHVPELDEIFGLLAGRKGSVPIAVDVKIDDDTVEADLVKSAEKHGVLDRLVFIGRTIDTPSVREKLRAASAKTHVAVLAQKAENLAAALEDADADWIYVRFIPSVEEVKQIHARGRKVLLVGPSVMGHEPENWSRALDAGVDAMLTDFPLECRQGWRVR